MAEEENKPKTETERQAKAAEEYHLGCSFMALREFKIAAKFFKSSLNLRGEATPDLKRNLAWCFYRIAEYEAFKNNYKDALENWQRAAQFYNEAQISFEERLKTARSKQLVEKVKFRIADCQKRIICVSALEEYVQRLTGYLTKKEEMKEP